MRPVCASRAVGEVDVLDHDSCEAVTRQVLALRPHWRSRAGGGLFATLGTNCYMDLTPSTDPELTYDRPARATNALLRRHFSELHARLCTVLEAELGRPVRLADDLALPGFHIWVADGIPQQPTASLHFDLQYRRVLERPPYGGASGTFSFTLPVRLPVEGSSLRVWPDRVHGAIDGPMSASVRDEPTVVPYQEGVALLHHGHLLHQIGVTASVRHDDLRITLQGHGLVVGGVLVLYW
jgi:hypothetical protein